MINRIRYFLLALLVVSQTSFVLNAQAEATAAGKVDATVDAKIVEAIRKRIMQARPDLVVGNVQATPIDNLYQASINNGPTIYTTQDGGFFLTGDLFEVRSTGLVNLAEAARETERVELLADIKPSEMIVFSPQVKKASVTVFTDVDCGYCQKLHREVPELNELGIEVRYLAFPRAGVGSPSFDKLVSAWCADDQQTAMTRLKNREQIPSASCANPVARQYRMGQEMGIQGTPAMITSDGRLLPGYMPAASLAEALGVASK